MPTLEMTREELKQFVEEVVEDKVQRYALWLKLSIPRTRPMHDVLDSIDRHRFTPPSGAKSAREMVREDRDA